VVLGSASAEQNWLWLVVAIALWTGMLTGASVVLLRRIRARQLEEGRQI